MVTAANVIMPDLHMGGQYQAFYSKARFKVLVCGRRWGKSLLAAVALITCAVGGGTGWWVWPSYPMARIGWRKLIEILQPLIAAKIVKVSRQENLIEFPGGGSIQMKSAERPNSLRGEGLDLVVVDEWAYIRNGKTVWEADLRAALSDKMGSAMLITTPNGMNFVFEYFHLAQNDPEYEAFHFPTWTNPYINKAEVEAARKSLPKAVFNQEYGAEFLEDAATFFTEIQRIMTADALRMPIEGAEYRAGLDIGRWRDRSVLAIGNVDLKPAQIQHLEIMEGLSFSIQKKKVLTLAEKWNINYLTMDITGMGLGLGEAIDEDAPFTCEPVTYTNKIKNDMMVELQGAYENDDLVIPDEEWLKVEHQMMIPQVSANGLSVKINARPGFFDDGPNACALFNRARKGATVTLA